MAHEIPVSIIILTYNRPWLIESQLASLSQIKYPQLEVIVVDNNSDLPLTDIIDKYPFSRLLHMYDNIGIAGRNRGIEESNGNIVITLDDDVSGINDDDIYCLKDIFRNPVIGAVCFRVIDEKTGETVNWCHHRKQEDYCNKDFITDEITEGAVAFRKSTLMQSGLYPEDFFISHEGPDLAFRIMNCGFKVIYNPKITVRHSHDNSGRQDWRRYYYDTRNLIWLVFRNYPVMRGIKLLTIGLGSMLIYSLRDGYSRFWIKGVMDGIKGSRDMLNRRTPFSEHTYLLIKEIDYYRPSLFYMIKKRLFKNKVRI